LIRLRIRKNAARKSFDPRHIKLMRIRLLIPSRASKSSRCLMLRKASTTCVANANFSLSFRVRKMQFVLRTPCTSILMAHLLNLHKNARGTKKLLVALDNFPPSVGMPHDFCIFEKTCYQQDPAGKYSTTGPSEHEEETSAKEANLCI